MFAPTFLRAVAGQNRVYGGVRGVEVQQPMGQEIKLANGAVALFDGVSVLIVVLSSVATGVIEAGNLFTVDVVEIEGERLAVEVVHRDDMLLAVIGLLVV